MAEYSKDDHSSSSGSRCSTTKVLPVLAILPVIGGSWGKDCDLSITVVFWRGISQHVLSEKRTATGGADVVWPDASATIALGSDRGVRFGALHQHLASRIAWWREGDHQDLIDGETSRAEQPIRAKSRCTITCGGSMVARCQPEAHHCHDTIDRKKDNEGKANRQRHLHSAVPGAQGAKAGGA